jgi:hypothetical protein
MISRNHLLEIELIEKPLLPANSDRESPNPEPIKGLLRHPRLFPVVNDTLRSRPVYTPKPPSSDFTTGFGGKMIGDIHIINSSLLSGDIHAGGKIR